MYTDKFDASGGLIPDPVIKSAQLRNRYDAWSRLSTPAQAVLNKLGPTDAYDAMAKNFTTAEDAQRAQGRDPYRDGPSAAAAMQSVDASPSITAMRALAPQGNKGAAEGVAAYHKRFDGVNATRVATAKAAQDRADAESKAKREIAMKQAEFDAKLAVQKLQNEGGLAQRKIQAQGDARYGKLQAENAELRRRGSESSAHNKRIQGIDRTVKSLYDKYGSAQAKAISHSRWITDPQAYNESLGFKDAPTDPTAFANWLLSQPGADVRLGVEPAAIDAYRQERGYMPAPEQPGGIQQMFGGIVDGVRQRLLGAGQPQAPQAAFQDAQSAMGSAVPLTPQVSPQVPPIQPQAPQQQMVDDPMSQVSPEVQQALGGIDVSRMPAESFAQLLIDARDTGDPAAEMAVQALKAQFNQAQPGQMAKVEAYVKGYHPLGAR